MAKEAIKRERSGNCQCWASNYNGEAVQRRCCRLILSSFILPFFMRNFICSGSNEPIDFFGNLVHNNSCSKQHQIDSDVTFVKQKVGPGQTAQYSHQKIRVSTSTLPRYTDLCFLEAVVKCAQWKLWGIKMCFADTSFSSFSCLFFLLCCIFKFSAIWYF